MVKKTPTMKKKVKEFENRQIKEMFGERYNHLVMHFQRVGRPDAEDMALTLIREEWSPKSRDKNLEKLRYRYDRFAAQPGVEAISVEDVKRTQKVEKWIARMQNAGLLIDEGHRLRIFTPVTKETVPKSTGNIVNDAVNNARQQGYY